MLLRRQGDNVFKSYARSHPEAFARNHPDLELDAHGLVVLRAPKS